MGKTQSHSYKNVGGHPEYLDDGTFIEAGAEHVSDKPLEGPIVQSAIDAGRLVHRGPDERESR